MFENELRVDPSDRNVLFTKPPRNSKSNREEMVTIAIEEFGVSAAQLGSQPLLASYGMGPSTGIVFDSGEDVTCVTPIHGGYCVARWDMAGRDLTRHMTKFLADEGSFPCDNPC
jgi:actin-related protein